MESVIVEEGSMQLAMYMYRCKELKDRYKVPESATMDFVPHPVQHLDGVHSSQKSDRNNCLSVCRVVLVGNRSGMVAAP